MAKPSGPGFPRNTFSTLKGGSGRTMPGAPAFPNDFSVLT